MFEVCSSKLKAIYFSLKNNYTIMFCKKLHALFILSLFTFHFSLLSQTSNPTCDSKRYLTNVFTDTTQTTVQYGANSDLAGNGQYLFMDIVEPKTDTVSKRPIIFLAFGGGFVQGTRRDAYMLGLCKDFASRGYVAITIDYRLHPFFLPIDSVSITNVIAQAMQDMRASIRYMVKDARTTNKFRIDTTNIFVGGLSAGAVTAMHVAYLDTTRNLPSWVLKAVRNQGGIDGNSGTPGGYSFKIKGVFSLSGALYSKDAFRAKDPAYISIHGTADKTLAYGYDKNIYGFYGDGDGSCYPTTVSLGIPSLHVAVVGSDHTDFYDFLNPVNSYPGQYAAFKAKADIFMKKLICGETISPTNNIVENFDLEVYPNPTTDILNVHIVDGNYSTNWQTELIDVTGKKVAAQKFASNQFTLSRGNLASGLYFLRITNSTDNYSTIKKVYFAE